MPAASLKGLMVALEEQALPRRLYSWRMSSERAGSCESQRSSLSGLRWKSDHRSPLKIGAFSQTSPASFFLLARSCDVHVLRVVLIQIGQPFHERIVLSDG